MQYMIFSSHIVALTNDSLQVETFATDIQEKSLHEIDILSSLANKPVQFVRHTITYCSPYLLLLFHPIS